MKENPYKSPIEVSNDIEWEPAPGLGCFWAIFGASIPFLFLIALLLAAFLLS